MDNGSGMSIEILKKYFLNVGVSYYASDDYLLQGRNYSPIGHYGIGFLACFMLSDRVEVTSEQKGLLDLFIESKYSKTNCCLK